MEEVSILVKLATSAEEIESVIVKVVMSVILG